MPRRFLAIATAKSLLAIGRMLHWGGGGGSFSVLGERETAIIQGEKVLEASPCSEMSEGLYFSLGDNFNET